MGEHEEQEQREARERNELEAAEDDAERERAADRDLEAQPAVQESDA